MSEMFGRARLLGFGILAVAFVAGALSGAAIDRAVSDDDMSGEPRRERSDDEDDDGRSYIIDRVEMTDVQRSTIDSILELRTRRMRAVWREVEPRMDAITDSARSEIMEVLTPEQQAAYERMLDRRRHDRRGDQDDRDDEDNGDRQGRSDHGRADRSKG